MKKKSKKFKLEEINDYMTRMELGEKPTIKEIDTIGDYIEELKFDTFNKDG